MINLLPYETKQQIRAARINTILVRYIIILGFSFVFIVVVCLGTYYFLNNNKTSAEESSDNTSSASVQAQASIIRTNLATSKSILDQQVSYSEILTGIAVILPSGTIINSLSLSDSSFGSTLNLQVLSTSDSNEQVLKSNIEKSSLFSSYELVSIAKNDAASTKTKYPSAISISFIINRGLAP